MIPWYLVLIGFFIIFIMGFFTAAVLAAGKRADELADYLHLKDLYARLKRENEHLVHYNQILEEHLFIVNQNLTGQNDKKT